MPTLTRGESSQLFAEAICRLTTLMLDANNQCSITKTARWLLEESIFSLVVGRAPASPTTTNRKRPGTIEKLALADRDEVASLKDALPLLEAAHTLDPLLDLLEVAVDEQVLIASVDSTRDDHEFTYAIPVSGPPHANQWPIRVAQSTNRILRKFARFLPNGLDYIVRYDTYIPSGVQSFHLTATTGDGPCTVRDALLTVESHRTRMDYLTKDLRYASDPAAHGPKDHPTLRQYEARHALIYLKELIHRRILEAEWQQMALNEKSIKTCIKLTQAPELWEGGAASETQIAKDLNSAAAEIDAASLGTGFNFDPNPVGPVASVFWRRSESGANSISDIPSSIYVRIVEDKAANKGTTAVFGLAVLLTTYLVFKASFYSWLPWDWYGTAMTIGNIAAKVTILLLIPGFLFTRLDLPDSGTISAELQLRSRLVSFCIIFSAVVASVIIVWEPLAESSGVIDFPAGGTLSVCLLAAQGFLVLGAWWSPSWPRVLRARPSASRFSPSRTKPAARVPAWIKRNGATRIDHFRREPDSIFCAVGPSDSARQFPNPRLADPAAVDMPDSARQFPNPRLADLAAVDMLVATEPLQEISLEVHHIGDCPGSLAALLADHGSQPFTETLSEGAYGLGLIIGTQRRDALPRPERDDSGFGIELVSDVPRHRRIFRSAHHRALRF